ncbi:DNA-binding domain-containing protein [Limosilactobacillus sp.]|jgi:two-component system response regulator YcbB|uniref:DNA-binding domain-containing protein n=1 Tax=Limosilactobacillus sp. TaxID=2773925 RepID=UPI0025C40474|nr:DNA-binding domain-containing protein [Limosilactobacillus sp.]MCH3922246.1 response regulator [Limosilactobacillus sp.]MCH3929018.1 response regulator [Limosilactobacillus sp.]
MNFYIVNNNDDDNATELLRNIIENDFNNSIVGTTTDPQQAFDDAMRLSIDIMFVDYAMPKMDGIDLVHRIQDSRHYPHFIMMATAIDPETRTKAYKNGIDFFLEKPLNIAEVKTVIKLAGQNIDMSKRLLQILDLVSGAATNSNTVAVSYKEKKKENARSILRFLGITSGNGGQEIISITNMMIERELDFEEINFAEAFGCDAHGKKIIFQRVRRDIRSGLNNLAHMCIDYPENDIILEYANNLYEYKNVHNEIAYLQGQRTSGGQVSIKHFFNGLVQESSK